jgi:hypothetical protein
VRESLEDPVRREDSACQMGEAPKLAEEEVEPRLLVQPLAVAMLNRLHRHWPIREPAVGRQALELRLPSEE